MCICSLPSATGRKGDYCGSGKNNLCLPGVPAMATCSGNTDVCVNVVAPGWKDCKDEPGACGKVVPNKAIRVPFSWIHAVLTSDTVSFVGCFGPVTDLSLTMLLLLPCESRDAWMLWRRMPLLFLSMYWLCNSGDWILAKEIWSAYAQWGSRWLVSMCAAFFPWKPDPVNA